MFYFALNYKIIIAMCNHLKDIYIYIYQPFKEKREELTEPP